MSGIPGGIKLNEALESNGAFPAVPGLDLETDEMDFDSMINLRPAQS